MTKFVATRLRTERKAATNSTYKKLAVQYSADTFVVQQTFVLRMNICVENRQLLVAANRQTVQKHQINSKKLFSNHNETYFLQKTNIGF